MSKARLYIAIAFVILGIVILIFASGARRFYSGGFFVLLGVINLVQAWRHTER